MNAADVRAELELDWSWREEELRLLRNQVGALADEESQRKLRKLSVVILYAHLEGFCRTALQTYLDAISRENLRVRDVTHLLAALSLDDIFGALANTDKKSKIFLNSLPDDNKLHTHARRAEFLSQVNDFDSRAFSVTGSKVVDTESNLKPAVLKKLLFQTGLDHDLADEIAPTLHKLLNTRNAIAHGVQRAGLDDPTFSELTSLVDGVVRKVTILVFQACWTQAYRRPPQVPG